jgi:hypothetical protein
MKNVLLVCIIVALSAASAGCIVWRDTEELPRSPKAGADPHAASHSAAAPTSTVADPSCDTCETGPVLQRPERVPLAKDRFVIFLFYSERACDHCKEIAAGTGKAISENFADRVESGTLECTALNVEDEANAHNQPDRWKKLARADELKDSDDFPAYVKKEIEAFIKGAAAGNK